MWASTQLFLRMMQRRASQQRLAHLTLPLHDAADGEHDVLLDRGFIAAERDLVGDLIEVAERAAAERAATGRAAPAACGGAFPLRRIS